MECACQPLKAGDEIGMVLANAVPGVTKPFHHSYMIIRFFRFICSKSKSTYEVVFVRQFFLLWGSMGNILNVNCHSRPHLERKPPSFYEGSKVSGRKCEYIYSSTCEKTATTAFLHQVHVIELRISGNLIPLICHLRLKNVRPMGLSIMATLIPPINESSMGFLDVRLQRFFCRGIA